MVMRPDMVRWIEAAANNGFDPATKNHLGEFFAIKHRDPIVKLTIQAFLQATAADGVKLTPRDATRRMMVNSAGDFSVSDWPIMHDAAPDYLGGD
jgi:hypothetical protein